MLSHSKLSSVGAVALCLILAPLALCQTAQPISNTEPPPPQQQTPAEFPPLYERDLSQLCGTSIPPAHLLVGRERTFDDNVRLPASFDWREAGGCPPIRDQGQCGGCWAFATMGMVECAIKIATGNNVNLSEQWLISCNTQGMGCNGGTTHQAVQHLLEDGLPDQCGTTGAVLESYLPYGARDTIPCACPYGRDYYIDDWGIIASGNVNAIKQAIQTYGPVACSMYTNQAFKEHQGAGVFNNCTLPDNPEDSRHGVVLVGWNDGLGAQGAWIVRNSWTTWWGMEGYAYVAYDCLGIGDSPVYVEFTSTQITDCNHNNQSDTIDIAQGVSEDCNLNGIPDECDLAEERDTDCNNNGVPDNCDIYYGTSRDCNLNGVPDGCDLANGLDTDCNNNDILDQCEIDSGTGDCNSNGVPDECDISSGISTDVDNDNIPDSCQVTHTPDPPHGAVDVPLTANLSWATVPGAKSYDIRFGTDPEPPSLRNSPSARITLSQLEYNQTYYWQITTRTANGHPWPSPIWSFTTRDVPLELPPEPTDPFPADGAFDVPLDVQLSWSCGGRIDRYEIGIAKDPHLTAKFLQAKTADKAWTQSINLSPDTTYYWQVRAENAVGDCTGPVWTFTTAAAIADEPVQSSPEDEAEDQSATDQPADETDGAAQDTPADAPADESQESTDPLTALGACPSAAILLILVALTGAALTRRRA